MQTEINSDPAPGPGASEKSWTSWIAALALSLSPVAAQAVQLDLLVLYDTHTQNYFNGQPATAIRSWVDQVNIMYRNSQVDIQLRLVGTRLHHPAGASMNEVLTSLQRDAGLRTVRDGFGADFVTQLHQTGNCGVGYLTINPDWAFNVVGPQCGPDVLAHELGHNMGLAHSRVQGDSGGTRYAYALGHGVQNSFGTIMSYPWLYNAERIPKFSNPRISCNGYPCGVPEGDPQQADAAKAINNVITELGNFRPTKVVGGGAVIADGVYRLKSVHSGRCVDVDADSLQNAGNVLQRTCDTGDSQRWRFTHLGGGYYEAKVKHSGKCLDVAALSQLNGGNVHQWTCYRGTNQQWLIAANGDGSYRLTARHSGRVLDVSTGSTADGANIHQWHWVSGRNQKWMLQKLE